MHYSCRETYKSLFWKLFQVLRVVKTRQVTHSVLQHLIDYVQNLEKIGLLEKKEMFHLHDAVQVPLHYVFSFTLLQSSVYIHHYLSFMLKMLFQLRCRPT